MSKEIQAGLSSIKREEYWNFEKIFKFTLNLIIYPIFGYFTVISMTQAASIVLAIIMAIAFSGYYKILPYSVIVSLFLPAVYLAGMNKGFGIEINILLTVTHLLVFIFTRLWWNSIGLEKKEKTRVRS